jgi:hypothetical protein
MRSAGSCRERAPKPWSRRRVHVSVRRGRAVRHVEHAGYAIAFAERDLAVCRTRAVALLLAGVAGLVIGAVIGSDALFAASGGFLGSGIGERRAPERLRRSAEANRRLLT